MNILDLLKDQLGGQIAGQLGGALGEPEEKTKGALDGMLGSILGGILGKASTPAGAEDLSKQLDNQDGGLLDSIGDIFSGGKQEEVAESGGGILGSLLGDKLGGIGDLLSGVSGMKSGSVLSMLKMLAPLVMGFLAKMKKSQGLDAGGFASMLMSQKENIATAMPEGMSDALGLKQGLLAQATDAADAATGAVGDVAAQGAQSGGNLLKLLLPLIIVGVLGYLGYNYIFSGAKDDEVETQTVQEKPANLAPSMGGGGGGGAAAGGGGGRRQRSGFALPDTEGLKETGGKFTALFDEAFYSLKSVTDEDTATTAVTTLGEITGKMDGLNDGFAALPEDAKSVLLDNIAGRVIPGLTRVFDEIKSLPGIEAILQPAIDALMTRLKAIGA